jgi:tRNA threonylcarbamoyladenosine biosynthesis protein TsaB
MLILSLDSAGSGCGLCVWRDGAALAEVAERMERGQDRRLMPLVLDVMERAHVGFEKLDRLAVTRGPGSFTGMRIGLAAARGMGLAAGKPVIGIDRFSIYHEPFKASGKKNLLVVIESRRRELFCRFYPASRPADEATMMTPDEIAAFLKAKGEVTVTGDRAAEKFTGFQPLVEPEHVVCAALAAKADAADPEFLPRPLYLRAPDVTMPTGKQGSEIRVLSNDHAALLAALHVESFGKERWSLEQIQSSLALKTTRGWGVFEGDEILGFILCQIIPKQSEVLTFCVRPSHRRRGVGERLMRVSAETAKKTGSDLFLEVAADNAEAVAMYNKLGFRETGRRAGYYRHGASSVDAVLFTLVAGKP